MAQFKLKTGHVVLVDDEDFKRAGRYKWHIMGDGYVGRCWRENKKVRTQYLHKFILETTHKVDHKDGDRLDNRRSNLRPATNAQNLANTLKFSSTNRHKTSAFRGVSLAYEGCGWQARLSGKYLGFFYIEIEAAKAYDAERRKWFGEFAQTNLGG